MIEAGNPDRDERHVEAMMASIHRAYDDQARDVARDEAIEAALGVDPDDPLPAFEGGRIIELAAAR